ncbi:MAG: restriction endonuclease subunit S [Bacteroidetes bacterium]|nr:restriction endonuclease subunit S [Bacteroidota bacterium]
MKWERKSLGEVIKLKRGYDLPSQKRKQGFVPIISSSGVTDFHSEPAKSGEGVVTGRYGTLGLLFYINGDYWPLNTTLYVQDFKGNVPRFIYYFLKTLNLEKFNGASAVPGLDRNVLHKIDVNYISHLPTQRRIASILSAYDDLIENNLKRIKLLEEKASLMYKLMQIDLSEAEKINLYDFADIQMGFAFKAEAFNEDGEGIPIIRIRDIPSQMTKSYTTQEVDNHYWVEKGDLLIGMDGEFHMNEWLGQRGYLVQRVCRLRAKNELCQSYLWQALKEPIHYYETTISGATVAHLGKKHLEEIFIAQPKDSMKNELEELNNMRKLKIVLAEQNAKLREARDILLPKLMNGQIEV